MIFTKALKQHKIISLQEIRTKDRNEKETSLRPLMIPGPGRM